MFRIIAEKVERDVLMFLELAHGRFLSWKGKDFERILWQSFIKTKTDVANLDPSTAKRMLEVMIEARMFYEKIYESYQRNEFRGACFGGTGQEAVGAGIGMATASHDVVTRDHRSFSLPLARGTPVDDFFLNYLMRKTGPTGGHNTNVHFTDLERNDIGFLISDMAMPIVIINGAVHYLNARQAHEKGGELDPDERSCGIGMMGDGAASNGLAHDGMNFAKARNLPVLFGILNNQISFRTSSEDQHGGIDLSNRGLGYEMPSFTVDGDNVFEVFFTARFLLNFCREANHPALLHALTFRRCGHNDTENTTYVKKIFEEKFLALWESEERDPIFRARKTFEEFGIIKNGEYYELKNSIIRKVQAAYERAFDAPQPSSGDLRDALVDPECRVVSELARAHPPGKEFQKMSFTKALREGHKEELRNDPFLTALGEDTGYPGGGAFAVTQGLEEEFGSERVMNSTLSESAIAGFVVGAGLLGGRTKGDFQFWNFFLSGPSPLLSAAATLPFLHGIGIPGVLSGPAGCGFGSNHHHEARPESYLAKALGIKIVVPSTAEDAKGLFKSAIRDPDMVAFVEEIPSYGVREKVPVGEYFTPFKPAVRRSGKDITLITWGFSMLKIALESAEKLNQEWVIDVEVIDLRVLNPLDKEFLFDSIKKTGRVIILHEDSGFMGFGAEISAAIAEDEIFYFLKAPISRVASKNIPIPVHLELEKARLPDVDGVILTARKLMEEKSNA